MAHLPRGVDVLWAHLSAFERISRNIDVFEGLALMFFVVFFVSAFGTRLTFFGKIPARWPGQVGLLEMGDLGYYPSR